MFSAILQIVAISFGYKLQTGFE